MSRSGSYDVIAVGDDLATLLAATLCARRGMRALLLTHDGRPNRYTLGSSKLPVDPSPWPLRRTPVERVLRDLGIDLAIRRKQREDKVSAQLCGHDLRLNLVTDAEAMREELEREFSGGAAQVQEIFDAAVATSTSIDALFAADPAFPATGFWDRKAQSKLAERVVADSAGFARHWSELRLPDQRGAVFAAAALAEVRDLQASPAALARAFAGWRSGVGVLRGDGDPVYSTVLEKFATAGGEVRSSRATELTVSWGKVTSVKTSAEEELGVGQLISALPLPVLAELLGKKAPSRLLELVAASRTVGLRYTLNLVIAEDGIPEGMAPVVFAASSAGWPFAILVGDPDDGGRVVVSLTTVIPVDGSLEGEALAERTAARRSDLLRELRLIMPFYERHLHLLHSPHDLLPPALSGAGNTHELPKGMPVPMRRVVRTDILAPHEGAGLASMPLVCGLKNLTLTGDQILPQLGAEGEVLAAWNASKQVCMAAGRKKDFLRDEVVGG